MIPMSCPKCGKRGSVPPDRLATRMSCRKCQAVFHMDRTGHIMLGEPEDENSTRKAKKPKRPKGQREAVDLGFGDMLKNVPKPVKAGLGAGVLVLVPFLLGLKYFWIPIPETLEGRAEYVASAFADDSAGRAEKIAVSGTADEVDAWFAKSRPLFKFQGPQSGPTHQVIAQVVDSSIEGDSATVVLKLVAPQPEPADEARADKPMDQIGYDENGLFDLPLYFAKQGSTWLLDGSKCLQQASTSSAAK